MKIYINARFLTQPITGVQRYGIECSRQIKKLYPDAVWICPRNPLNKAVASELGAIETGKQQGHRWEQFELPAFLRKQGTPPLINLANTAPLFYTNNYIALHDLAFHFHPEWNARPFAMFYNFLIPRLAKKAKKLFTVSETVKKEIIQEYRIPGERICVTYNGLSDTITKMIPKGGTPAKKENIILSVGTFNARKNQAALIRAFSASEIKRDHQLWLVGDRNKVFKDAGFYMGDEELKRNNIIIPDHLSEKELVLLYEKACAVVSVSRYEGFGIPILEGLYAGCRILCSDIPVYRELFDGQCTWCTPGDENSIRLALAQLVAAPAGPAPATRDSLFAKYNYQRSAETILRAVTGSDTTTVTEPE